MSQRIVINTEFGGFSLSREAVLLARKLSNNPKWGGATIAGDLFESGETCEDDYGFIHDIPRDDPILVKIVDRLGERSWGERAELKIVNVPDGVQWHIHEYDGTEYVAENHRRWF